MFKKIVLSSEILIRMDCSGNECAYRLCGLGKWKIDQFCDKLLNICYIYLVYSKEYL